MICYPPLNKDIALTWELGMAITCQTLTRYWFLAEMEVMGMQKQSGTEY